MKPKPPTSYGTLFGDANRETQADALTSLFTWMALCVLAGVLLGDSDAAFAMLLLFPIMVPVLSLGMWAIRTITDGIHQSRWMLSDEQIVERLERLLDDEKPKKLRTPLSGWVTVREIGEAGLMDSVKNDLCRIYDIDNGHWREVFGVGSGPAYRVFYESLVMDTFNGRYKLFVAWPEPGQSVDDIVLPPIAPPEPPGFTALRL